MYSYAEAFDLLKIQLTALYDERESMAIAHEVLSFITSFSKVQRLIQKKDLFTTAQQLQFTQALRQLMQGMPLQYVTGIAWFLGKEFTVNKHVLIPRPETEELVHWIIPEHQNKEKDILDIGTGSGCIPIALKLALPTANVTSCDISLQALHIAKINADNLGANITLVQMDFLNTEQQNKLGKYDVIVSNPPYIPLSEKEKLHTNVRDYEPGIALFVPDEDALIFYKAIAEFGKTHLNKNGSIYCELDAANASACKILFETAGYWEVTLRKDMYDNWRFLSAIMG